MLRVEVFCPHDETGQWNYVSAKNSVTSNCRAVRYTQSLRPAGNPRMSHPIIYSTMKLKTFHILSQVTIDPSTKLCALNCWMGVYTAAWRGPGYMRVILLSLDTKTYRGTQLLLYQCVHFLKPLAFTDASIETSAPFSVEQTAFGASRYSCCVHLLSCNTFHWEAQYMW